MQNTTIPNPLVLGNIPVPSPLRTSILLELRNNKLKRKKISLRMAYSFGRRWRSPIGTYACLPTVIQEYSGSALSGSVCILLSVGVTPEGKTVNLEDGINPHHDPSLPFNSALSFGYFLNIVFRGSLLPSGPVHLLPECSLEKLSIRILNESDLKS